MKEEPKEFKTVKASKVDKKQRARYLKFSENGSVIKDKKIMTNDKIYL